MHHDLKSLTPEQEKALEQIQKLMNLAAKNNSQGEAEAAAAKAQELLTKYNLDTATLERAAGGSGKRVAEQVEGGFYHYQRELWNSIAELNFCLYWTQTYYPEGGRNKYNERVQTQRRHKLIGRTVNVRTTINMANYLLATIERVTREVCDEKKLHIQSAWARSFREGCVHQVIERLEEKRGKIIAAEEKAKRQAEARARKAGVSLETALTITSFAATEEDENWDFHQGDEPGTRARERIEWAAEQREREEAHTRWAAEHPEEARRQEEEREKEVRRSRYRGGERDTRYDHIDWQAFHTGGRAGKSIGLDPQTKGGPNIAGRLK